MKPKKLFFLFAALLMAVSSFAQFEKAPAFPGAEGFARLTTSGGRGGKVYHVTSLADDGSVGTFRWACSQSDTRTIVFDVSGTIYLTSELALTRGNVSILGQTAPGDGICIADYPFTIKSSNVIIRYMRFRLGNRQVAYHEGDGLGGMDQANIIVDHCSVSWSIDECLSVYGSQNISVQWNIVDQSLVNSGHSKGAHGYGGNWGGSGASYHHNLMAHHTSRTPRLGPRPGTQTDERMDMRNNVIYNWGGNGCYGGEGMNVNIVNNYYKPGPGTLTRSSGIQKRIAAPGIRTSEYTAHNTANPNGWDVMWHVWGKYYVDGNFNPKHADVTKDNWTYGIYNQIDASGNDGTYTAKTKDTIKITTPIPYGYVTTQTAETAYEKVVKYAGASYKRDSHDTYIANDVATGTASHKAAGTSTGFINNQNEAGGWPDLQSLPAPKDTDGDGIPDEWETYYGLNPNDANDGKAYTLDEKHYYTNLEVYCNKLVEEQIKDQNADALEVEGSSFEEYYPVIKRKWTPDWDEPYVNITDIILDKEEVTAVEGMGTVTALSRVPEDATLEVSNLLWRSETPDLIVVPDETKGSFFVTGSGVGYISVYSRDPGKFTKTVKVIATGGAAQKGDADGDGSVSMTDANMTVNYYLGTPQEGFIKDNADVDGDGNISMSDANGIVNIYLEGAPVTVKWDFLADENIAKIVGEEFFNTTLTTSGAKVMLNNGVAYDTFRYNPETTKSPATTYPVVGFVKDVLVSNAPAYNAYMYNYLCLNLGTEGWAEFTTFNIPAGKYNVVLHYVSDTGSQSSFYTAGTPAQFDFCGNTVTATLLKGLKTGRTAPKYQSDAVTLWENIEVKEGGKKPFRITLKDEKASSTSSYHLYLDYVEFVPVQ